MNPVERAAQWANEKEQNPQGGDLNFSALARILGVPRQSVQKWRRRGWMPEKYVEQVLAAADGELTDDELTP